MSEGKSTTLDELVARARGGRLSRRRLIAGLTGLGLTGAGAAAVAAVVAHRATPAQHRQQLQQHDQHVTRQVRGDVHHMMADYAPDAVVEDPLFARPFVGVEAIAARYAAEVASTPDRALTILNRVVAGAQLVVEWEARGTHVADFLGFGGTGRAYCLRGVTVVMRRDGLIVRESHYYDAADLRAQVEGHAR